MEGKKEERKEWKHEEEIGGRTERGRWRRVRDEEHRGVHMKQYTCTNHYITCRYR